MKNTDNSSPQIKIKYAGFMERIIATMIDVLVSGVFFFPIFSLIAHMLYGDNVPMQVIMQSLSENMRYSDNFMSSLDASLKDQKVISSMSGASFTVKYIIEQVLQFALLSSFFYIFWTRRQATPGKMLLSLKIVDEKTLEKPSKKQLIIRFFGCILSALFFFLSIFWVIFSKKKKAWHDYMASTVVIKY